MGLRGKVDDAVHVLFLHELQDTLEVADVHLHKAVVGPVLNVFQIGKVSRIGELVKVDDPVFRVLVYKQPYNMAADKSGSAGDYQSMTSYHITTGL